MNISKFYKYVWTLFDSLLVLSIIILMGVILFAPVGNGGVCNGFGRARNSRGVPRFQPVRYINGQKFVSVAPVVYKRENSAQIARNMVGSESVKLPLRPALDMRERNQTYEVRFALPQGTKEDDVSVRVSGNILTLLLESDERAFMRRIRIPCDYAQNSALSHFVSNQVLYVNISAIK